MQHEYNELNLTATEGEEIYGNILDSELELAQDELRGMRLERLCYIAIEIDNGSLQAGPDGEMIQKYLSDINTEIIKRTAFWTVAAGIIAFVAAAAGGVLVLHLCNGTVLTDLLVVAQGAFALGALIIAAAFANRKLIAIGEWACNIAADATMRRRENLERERDERER